ncbi:MAG: transglycosylase SLT domain-containing protein [Rhodospirillaceae bacterium]|nr:transglycosylase SLT domain-containing protein [Rhodospirillaceae bacterium]MBT5456101.1 transglycosylase SLT domain-containing protein [Rhodospirillaceae bacterium]
MRSVVLVSLLAALISQLAPKMALAGPDSSRICASAIHAAELSQRLPRFLLHAVSLAESGRWDKKAQARIAWPWTVTAGGKGKFFPTKAKALAEVKRLRADGIRNIDVGCMQVNLKYHGHIFGSVEEAFDPVNNVAYAAAWLKSLRDKKGSWAHAVGRYHNGHWKKRGQGYWRRVYSIWTNEQKQDFHARKKARIAANRRRNTLARR